jgi:hypothetical protein
VLRLPVATCALGTVVTTCAMGAAFTCALGASSTCALWAGVAHFAGGGCNQHWMNPVVETKASAMRALQ